MNERPKRRSVEVEALGRQERGDLKEGFERLAGIPAPTGEEEKSREYIKRLVEEWNEKIADPERKFEVHEDKAG
ncbi:MAG: hypothetical protein AAB538_03650, partial [Patescibacteria group bacterium]